MIQINSNSFTKFTVEPIKVLSRNNVLVKALSRNIQRLASQYNNFLFHNFIDSIFSEKWTIKHIDYEGDLSFHFNNITPDLFQF